MSFKVASILMALWAVLQGYFLTEVGLASSGLGWGLCLIALILALLLLTGKNWARVSALIASLFILTIYGYILLRSGAPDLIAWVQPALALILVGVLAKPPSNQSLQSDAPKVRR